jgi:hypothetical protein
VDLLLLIAGINDIGFSKWVTATIANKTVSDLLGGFIPRASDPETQLRLKRLEFRYSILRQALDEHFLADAGLKVAQSTNGSVLSNVVMPLYPRALEDSQGTLCAHGNQGMTAGTFPDGMDASRSCAMRGSAFFSSGLLSLAHVSGPVLAVRNADDLGTIESFRNGALEGGVAKFAEGSANRPAYTLLAAPNDPRGRFANRGFCATTDRESEIEGVGKCISFSQLAATPRPVCWTSGQNFDAPATCITTSAESLHVARDFFSVSAGSNPDWGGFWRPFAPGSKLSNYSYYPYARRSRLFRTPNDVYMLINNRPSTFSDDTPPGILDLAGRASSGAFHPTAEAHSIIAGMVVEWALNGPFMGR